MCRKWKIWEHSVPNKMSSKNPSPKGSEIYVKEDEEKILSARCDEWLQESRVFWMQQDWCTYKITETVSVCTGPAWVLARYVPNTERIGRHRLQILTKKLSAADSHLQRKTWFFSSVVSQGIVNIFQDRTHIKEQLANTTNSMVLSQAFCLMVLWLVLCLYILGSPFVVLVCHG